MVLIIFIIMFKSLIFKKILFLLKQGKTGRTLLKRQGLHDMAMAQKLTSRVIALFP